MLILCCVVLMLYQRNPLSPCHRSSSCPVQPRASIPRMTNQMPTPPFGQLMSLLARAICKVRTHHSPRQSWPAKVDPSRPRAAAVHRQEPPPITSPDSHISCRAFICLPLAVPDRSRPLESTRCLQDRFFFPLCFGSAPK